MRTALASGLVGAVLMGIVGLAVLRFGAASTAGQGQAYSPPRTADGRPDLNGVWQALNTANYDIQDHPARPAMALIPAPARSGAPGTGRATPTDLPAAPVRALGAVGGVPAGRGVVEGNEIPYQPWAAARRKENADNWLTRDPEIKCYLPGVPRVTYMPYPFQILQGTDKILIAYEFAGATRTIHMTGDASSPSDTWMGWSRGRWEGDTLVVDVTSFNDQTWFDRAGNFHSEALHVIERYTRVSPSHLMYEVTIEDPKVFTRPWRMSMPLYRRFEPDARVLEYKCVEFVEQLMYGDLGVRDPAAGAVD
jgi:hypothetical protein